MSTAGLVCLRSNVLRINFEDLKSLLELVYSVSKLKFHQWEFTVFSALQNVPVKRLISLVQSGERFHCTWILIRLLRFTSASSAAGSPGIWGAITTAVWPSGSLPPVPGLLLGRVARQTGAVHDVGIQHLQQQVVQRHHVLHFHAVEVVHAFVAAHFEKKSKMKQNNDSIYKISIL